MSSKRSFMYKNGRLPPAKNIVDYHEIAEIITKYILEKACVNKTLNILEAGCGRRWRLDLKDVQYTLTGVDLDKNALEIRKNKKKDLDIAIFADLRTVSLEENSYDIIYSDNVLEHIDGAEVVLMNFVRWLKPGGIIILLFPNRDSAYAFMTRMTPFWAHVFLKKYIEGNKNAGKPGYDPYPVSFDKVVSRNGIYEFCEKNGLIVKAEFRMDGCQIKNQIVWFFAKILIWGLCLFSFLKLSFNYKNLVFIVEKPNHLE
jgi:SAM-dependent methyltransferase